MSYSKVDPTVPPEGDAFTADVRQNFQYSKDELNDLDNRLKLVSTPLGVTDGSPAIPGEIGEFVIASQTSPVSVSDNIPTDIISITLTAGDWDIHGYVYFQCSNSGGTDDLRGWINTVSATQPTGDAGGLGIISTTSGGYINTVVIPPVYILSNASTIVYLGCNANYGSGTMTVKGFIRARRMR